MRGVMTWSLALCLLAVPALAGNGPGDSTPAARDDKSAPPPTSSMITSTTTAKPVDAPKPATTTPPAASAASIDTELQQMRALMAAQAKQLADQQAALQEQQKQMDALRAQIHTASVSPSNAGEIGGGNGIATPA